MLSFKTIPEMEVALLLSGELSAELIQYLTSNYEPKKFQIIFVQKLLNGWDSETMLLCVK